MVVNLKNQAEIMDFLNHFFNPDDSLEIESKDNIVIFRKVKNITEDTKGTIKNLDKEIIKQIAEDEDYCGY